MLGSLCHLSASVRRRAVDHVLDCIEIAREVGSSIVSLWLADGTNYPGQDDLRARRRRLLECLRQIYAALPPGVRLLVEYKFFEPGFYSTDLPDWVTAYTVCLELGPEAKVLVDTGHHAQGVNVEQIVAGLLDRGRLGGFHFNARKYADDDLIVGSSNPFEPFLIFNELVAAEDDHDQVVAPCARDVAYMIDQSHNIEPKVEAMVQSVVNIQVAHAKALLVDRPRLLQAQSAGDVLEANRVLLEAYESDVRPLLAKARARLGLDPDPVSALRRSRYQERVASERRPAAAGSGYPGAWRMGKTVRLLATDLGAESGRSVVGSFDGERLIIEEVHRFRNRPVEAAGTLPWDVLGLYAEMLDGIRAAGCVASVGIDTWGVDFDPDDERLLRPGDMPERTAAVSAEQGQTLPSEPGVTARCVFVSLALKYGRTIEQLEHVFGLEVRVIHIVGGGAHDRDGGGRLRTPCAGRPCRGDRDRQSAGAGDGAGPVGLAR